MENLLWSYAANALHDEVIVYDDNVVTFMSELDLGSLQGKSQKNIRDMFYEWLATN